MSITIHPCGNCAGCDRDRAIRSALDELTSFYMGRAKQLKDRQVERGYSDRDADRRDEWMLRREWDERTTGVIKAMRPTGCLRPTIINTSRPSPLDPTPPESDARRRA